MRKPYLDEDDHGKHGHYEANYRDRDGDQRWSLGPLNVLNGYLQATGQVDARSPADRAVLASVL